ncbi:glycine cleavage system protein H [Blattabacterium cuenoti]|uniref:glycine cleavage system protein H n=1 Tax=Blattabacterium cuenoti TaxID=1653831 RepID=UPI00163C1D3D|nr:glycine cleavage system protein H [Blattabacterium cuenoti]
MNKKDLKYSKNHEWVGIINYDNSYIDNNNKNKYHAFIGITYFAQKELGDIVYLDIDNSILKKEIKEKEVFGTIEAVKTVSDLFMPVSGIILEINDKLISNPELINKNSYEEWMIKIIILDISTYDKLMSFKEYEKYISI